MKKKKRKREREREKEKEGQYRRKWNNKQSGRTLNKGSLKITNQMLTECVFKIITSTLFCNQL
jgi:hypothetical protein